MENEPAGSQSTKKLPSCWTVGCIAVSFIISFDVFAALFCLRSGLKLQVPPMCRAARQGDVVAIRKYLRDGASPDTADERGGTALMYAAGKGHMDVVKLLVQAGADIHAQRDTGGTMIHASATPELIEYFLGAGLDINALDTGRTSPYLRAEGGDLDGIRCLMKHGADPTITGIIGTPLEAAEYFRDREEDPARAKRYDEIAQLLRKYMRDYHHPE